MSTTLTTVERHGKRLGLQRVGARVAQVLVKFCESYDGGDGEKKIVRKSRFRGKYGIFRLIEWESLTTNMAANLWNGGKILR